ncbi:AsmA-like C-terminal region-containing protein [Thalassospiraceae bacterium LMO-JJ14]|nr:AsmA-like C-terminal region-containing protein [Thalassospiraceae bacterium LMO-JJ14]
MRKTPELVDDADAGALDPENSWMVEVEGAPSRFPLLAKFGIALGMLTLVFVAFLALGPMVLPASLTVSYAERLLTRATGVDMVIKGGHSFRILPSLRLEAQNAVSRDEASPLNLNLPYLAIEFSALGALSGSADLEHFLARDPVIRFQSGKMLVDTSGQVPEIDRAWGWWRDMSLKQIKIENGALLLSDSRSGRMLKLEGFTAASTAPGEGQVNDGLFINGAGTLNGRDIKLGISASNPQLLVSGNRWPFELSVNSALLSGTFKGSIAVRERTVGDGEMKLSSSDIVELNHWIGPFLPARNPGSMALNATVDFAGDVLDVRRMDLKFGDTSLSGNVKLEAMSSGAPVVNGRFDAETLDLGTAPVGDAMVVAEAPLMIPGMPSGKIEISWQRARWMNVLSGAGHARIERQPSTQRLSLILDDTAIYGGTMRGLFTLDASEGMRALNIEGRALGVNIGPLLSGDAKHAEPLLSGRSTIELNLFSVGGTAKELIEALTGEAEVVAQDGQLMIMELVHGLVPEAENGLPFKSLNGRFTIAQGIAVSDDLLLRSGKLSLVGKGRVDLADWTIDLNIGRLGNDGGTRSLTRYRVSGPAGEMHVEPINGS